MSHTTSITVKFKSATALALALCDAYKLEASQVEVHDTPVTLNGYSVAQNRTAHVLVRKGSPITRWADMGFLLEGDDATLHYDHLDERIPAELNSVKKHYSKHVVIDRARRAGQSVEVLEQADGTIRLTVR